MRAFGIGAIFLGASIGCASAQVSVEVVQDQQEFLEGEALPVAVRVTNRSGQALRLGAEADWLTFEIENQDGRMVIKNGDTPVVGEFVLESSKVAVKHVDLEPYFLLGEPGRYDVRATVRIKNWGRELTSQPLAFNIIEGTKLCELEVGLPPAPGVTNSLPEVRHYILQQANYLKTQLRLYLRVTDAYGKVFRVLPIGPMVSFGRPEPQVDKASNLHLLYQYGPSSFSYTVFNPEGELLKRQTYDYVSSRPRLQVNENGTISVLGGVRRMMSSDVPAAKPPLAPEQPPAASKPVSKPDKE